MIELDDLRAVRLTMELSRSDSVWLFPQPRLRLAGDAGDGHIADRTLTAQLELLQAEGRSSTVEEIHYNADSRMKDKAEILQAWEKFILALTDKYAPKV